MSNRFSKRGAILTTKHTKHTKEDWNRNARPQGGEMTKDQRTESRKPARSRKADGGMKNEETKYICTAAFEFNKESMKPGTGSASASWFPGFLVQCTDTSTVAAGRDSEFGARNLAGISPSVFTMVSCSHCYMIDFHILHSSFCILHLN
jgi:hypothetical protein